MHRRGRVSVIAGLALLIIAALAAATYYWVQIPLVKFTLQAGQCKWGPPLAGVYLSGRLRLVDRCKTVSGTVDCLKLEPDGDYHVRLRVDEQYVALLTPANDLQTCTGHPGPHLVVEIIPQHPHGVLFRANNADAGGFNDPLTPAPGDHATVTGPYVIDPNRLHRTLCNRRSAENWAEIHPAWGLRDDKDSTPGEPNY